MTSGERMLFAVAFDRSLVEGYPPDSAAEAAAAHVLELAAARRSERLSDDARAMLDDMLGTGVDRVPIRSVGGTIVGELEVPR